MLTRVNCVKCRKEFEVKMIPIHDSRQYTLKDENQPRPFCKIRSKKEFAKCELCRNVGKALDFLNTIMEKEN